MTKEGGDSELQQFLILVPTPLVSLYVAWHPSFVSPLCAPALAVCLEVKPKIYQPACTI